MLCWLGNTARQGTCNGQNEGFTGHVAKAHLLHTLKPDRWSQAFLASKMSSYTTNAVPLVSGVLPTRICLMAPYFPNMSYLESQMDKLSCFVVWKAIESYPHGRETQELHISKYLHFLRCDLVRQVPDVQHSVHLWRQPHICSCSVHRHLGCVDYIGLCKQNRRSLKSCCRILVCFKYNRNVSVF